MNFFSLLLHSWYFFSCPSGCPIFNVMVSFFFFQENKKELWFYFFPFFFLLLGLSSSYLTFLWLFIFDVEPVASLLQGTRTTRSCVTGRVVCKFISDRLCQFICTSIFCILLFRLSLLFFFFLSFFSCVTLFLVPGNFLLLNLIGQPVPAPGSTRQKIWWVKRFSPI